MLIPKRSRGNPRRISSTPYGHGLDLDIERLHWLRHDSHARILRG